MDAKLDAKRLEELAERLMLGKFTIEDQRDAARCAKAWAKVERIVRGGDDIALALCFGGEIKIVINDLTFVEWKDTAIAAVEAAPEVEP